MSTGKIYRVRFLGCDCQIPAYHPPLCDILTIPFIGHIWFCGVACPNSRHLSSDVMVLLTTVYPWDAVASDIICADARNGTQYLVTDALFTCTCPSRMVIQFS